LDDSGMAYQVIALRYRPRRFSEVVGQEETAETLRRAVVEGRLAHAYLFAGPRGVGKTSMARILAMALNCPNVKEGEPCTSCDICRDIAAGADLDVQELDGASHRGIDDVRELIAGASCAPIRARVKVYIVDEVHMLTREAFNAFLKTLEEPPAHVKFILATTEPQRIPETVASRLQRFDFRPISEADVVRRLTQICEQEGVSPGPGVLERIAQYAHGGMRDAQTLLDQLITFAGNEPTLSDLDRVAGRLDRENLRELLGALESGEVKTVWEITRRALSGATTPEGLLEQILLETREELERSVQQRDEVPEALLLRGEIIAETISRLRTCPFPEILTELTLLRLCSCGDLASIGELLAEARGEGSENREPQRRNTLTLRSPRAERTGSAAGLKSARQKESSSPGQAGLNRSAGTSPPVSPSGQQAPNGVTEGPAKALSPEEREKLFEKIRQLWPAVTTEVGKRSVALGEFLRTGRPAALAADGTLQVEVRNETVLRRLTTPDSKSLISKALSSLLERPLQFEIRLRPQERSAGNKGNTGNLIEDDPLFRKAREIFGAEP